MESNLTIGRLFWNKSRISQSKTAIGYIENGQVKFLSYSDYRKIVKALTFSLIKHHFQFGMKVAILSRTTKEWHFCDLAVLCGRGIVVPIHTTLGGNDINYILDHSESSILIVESNIELRKIIDYLPQLMRLNLIIGLQPLSQEVQSLIPSRIKVLNYEDLLKEGMSILDKNEFNFHEMVELQSNKEIASIVYTTGSNGQQIGVVISHQAFIQSLNNFKSFTQSTFGSSDRSLIFLPLTHILGRLDSLFPLISDWEIIFAPDSKNFIQYLSLAKPTVLFLLPRFIEKIYEKIWQDIQQQFLIKDKIFNWALNIANNYHEKIAQDLSPSPKEILEYNIVYQTCFSKIIQIFGGKLRYIISNGAPLDPKIHLFFRNLGLTILEGYGSTETIGPCFLNPLYKQIPGTAGIPIGDVELSFTGENEIIIKSKALFSEYFKNPHKTQNHLQEGKFITGDIGQLNSLGFLEIIDCKSNIFTLKSGDIISAQKIEKLMRSKPHISHFMAVGENRDFLIGIVGIEIEHFQAILPKLQQKNMSLHNLSQHPEIYELIHQEIQQANKMLPLNHQIIKFIISPEEFTVEGNHLTPSFKVSRKFLTTRFAEEINNIYEHSIS